MMDDLIAPRGGVHRAPVRRRWLSQVMGVTFLLVVLAGGVLGVRKLAQPILLGCAQGRENEQLRQQLDAERKEKIRLEREIPYMKTPAGALTEARKLGYARKGEIPLVIKVVPPRKNGKKK